MWIAQDFFELYNDEEVLFPERVLLDRVTARWYTSAPLEHRLAYGPCLATIVQALEWAVSRSDYVTIELDDVARRWKNRDELGWPKSTVKLEAVGQPTAWRAHWRATPTCSDHEIAAPGFAGRLAATRGVTAPCVHQSSDALVAEFTVQAANEALAHHVAQHLGLRAATDIPNGLGDLHNQSFSVLVEPCAD